jgi:hypothetical protein
MTPRSDESGGASYVAGLVRGLTDEFRDYRGERRQADEARDKKMGDHIDDCSRRDRRIDWLEHAVGREGDVCKLKTSVDDLVRLVDKLRALIGLLVGTITVGGVIAGLIYHLKGLAH